MRTKKDYICIEIKSPIIMKKYKLTEETLRYKRNKILRRVQAVRDFGNVKEGQKGGWVEGEWNLSHDGDCWVDEYAVVWGNARIEGNAHVSLFCEIRNSAIITDNAIVKGNAKISGNAKICENAKIFENAKIYGNVVIGGDVEIGNTFTIKNKISLKGNARIMSKKDIDIYFWHTEHPVVVTKKPKTLYHCGSFTGTYTEFIQFLKSKNIPS